MDDPLLVSSVHRASQRPDQMGCLAGWQRRYRQAPGQAAAGDVLERHERPFTLLTNFEDLHDVRVLQPGRRSRLGPEPRKSRRCGVLASQDHLERDQATELAMSREV